jgi:hypothetical protein
MGEFVGHGWNEKWLRGISVERVYRVPTIELAVLQSISGQARIFCSLLNSA